MNKTIVTYKKIEILDHFNKVDYFTVNDEEVSALVDITSIDALRMLTYVLKAKGIPFQPKLKANSYDAIASVTVFGEHDILIKTALQEILEYRCSSDLRRNMKWVIRSLPFELAMKTSDSILKTENIADLKAKALPIINADWTIYSGIMAQFPDIYPTMDNEINNDIKMLKKHLICKSFNGGYDIKTNGYSGENLKHQGYPLPKSK